MLVIRYVFPCISDCGLEKRQPVVQQRTLLSGPRQAPHAIWLCQPFLSPMTSSTIADRSISISSRLCSCRSGDTANVCNRLASSQAAFENADVVPKLGDLFVLLLQSHANLNQAPLHRNHTWSETFLLGYQCRRDRLVGAVRSWKRLAKPVITS